MSVSAPVYQEYTNTICDGCSKQFQQPKQDIESIAIINVAQLFHFYLENAHNASTEPNVENKHLKLALIELGFVGNTIFAVVETVVRAALAPLLLIGALFSYLCGDTETTQVFLFFSLAVTLPALTTLQSAVSTYTNIAYPNDKIDYYGQARCHLFGQQPDRIELNE